ncbi:ethanolamine kinase 1-like [Glandiceps talaboti]
MATSTGVPTMDVTVDENNPKEGALNLMKHVRPEWKRDNIQFKVFTEGITNKIYGCYLPDDKRNMVLLRVYGEKTELIIDRVKEIETFQVLFKAKCGAELYCIFNNGLCYQFMPGKILDPELVRADNVYPLIARKMAKMHLIKPADGKAIPEPSLFLTLKGWLENIPREFDDAEKNARFQKEIPSHEQLGKEIDLLESVLKPLNSPIVFCHNDLLLANVIYDEQTDSISFIDYEYATYNYQGFDIANHFAEYAGVEEVDYSLYPEKEYQKKWLREYLSAYYAMAGINRHVTDKELEKNYVQVNKFCLASHFFWGLWALIQSAHSTIDFDFLGYGAIRLGEYFRRKEEFLALQVPSD